MIILFSIIGSTFYSIQESLEKYIFKGLNLNTYLLYRYVLITLLFAFIYFFIPNILLNNKKKEDNKINYKILIYILLASITSIIYSVITNYSISKYNFATFTILFTVFNIIFNTISGYFIFNEKINLMQLGGIILSIFGVAIIILNKKT